MRDERIYTVIYIDGDYSEVQVESKGTPTKYRYFTLREWIDYFIIMYRCSLCSNEAQEDDYLCKYCSRHS